MREIYEELGESLTTEKLLWIVEEFFEFDNVRFHEIAFYYKLVLTGKESFLHLDHEFLGPENIEHQFFKWIPVEHLHQYDVYPQFLYERCNCLPKQIEHIVIDQLNKSCAYLCLGSV